MRISRLRVLLAALLAGLLIWISVVLKSHIELDIASEPQRARPLWQQQFIGQVKHYAKDSELDEEGGRDWREIERRVARADGSLQPTDYFSFLDKHVNMKTESLVDQLVPKVSPSSSHIVTVTDCTLLHDWQSLLLFYSASLVEQHGNFTRIVANCNEKAQFELYNQYLRKWPNYSIYFCSLSEKGFFEDQAFQRGCVEEFVASSGSATITPDASLLVMPVEALFLQGSPQGSLSSLGSPSASFDIKHPHDSAYTVHVSHLTQRVILSDPVLAVDKERSTWALVDSLGSHAVCEMPHRGIHPDDQPLVLVVPQQKEYRLAEYAYSASLFNTASAGLFQCGNPLLKDVDPQLTARPTHGHSHYPEDQKRLSNARTAFVLCHLYRVLNGFVETVKDRFCSVNDFVNVQRSALL